MSLESLFIDTRTPKQFLEDYDFESQEWNKYQEKITGVQKSYSDLSNKIGEEYQNNTRKIQDEYQNNSKKALESSEKRKLEISKEYDLKESESRLITNKEIKGLYKWLIAAGVSASTFISTFILGEQNPEIRSQLYQLLVPEALASAVCGIYAFYKDSKIMSDSDKRLKKRSEDSSKNRDENHRNLCKSLDENYQNYCRRIQESNKTYESQIEELRKKRYNDTKIAEEQFNALISQRRSNIQVQRSYDYQN